MITVYVENRPDDRDIELLFIRKIDSVYLTQLASSYFVGDNEELDGYFRITEDDVYYMRENVLEKFHMAEDGLTDYIDADTDLINLLRTMNDKHKYFIKIIENEGDEQ